MNIFYEYQIANLDVADINGMSDVVVAIHYRVVATGEGVDIHPVHSGVVELDAPSEDFTEFSSLTKEQVEQWVKSRIDVEGIEHELNLQLSCIAAEPSPVKTTSRLPAWQRRKSTDAAGGKG